MYGKIIEEVSEKIMFVFLSYKEKHTLLPTAVTFLLDLYIKVAEKNYMFSTVRASVTILQIFF